MEEKIKQERDQKVKTLRLFQIAEFIKTHNYPNEPAIRKHFGYSRSTIMRDIEFLQTRYNAPIEYSQEHKGYYYTDPGFNLPSLMLSEGELFTLYTLMPLMDQYKNTPLESTFKSIITKMMEMMPNKVEIDSSFTARDVQFIKDPLPEISETIFNSVFDAIGKGKSLKFDYRSISKQDYTSRKFDPYKVLCQKGNWYVIGYCHLHNRFSVYALSRMKDLVITEDSFEVRPDFDLSKHIDPEFGIWHTDATPLKIELLFAKEINTYILERTWHAKQECHQNEDGSVYLSFMSNQLQETLYWVMHFGASVEVLNPPELKEMVKTEVQKMIAKF